MPDVPVSVAVAAMVMSPPSSCAPDSAIDTACGVKASGSCTGCSAVSVAVRLMLPGVVPARSVVASSAAPPASEMVWPASTIEPPSGIRTELCTVFCETVGR